MPRLTQLATDRDHANVGILVHVLKSFSAHLLAPAPLHEAGESFEAEKDAQTSLVSPTAKARFRKLFETYYATFARRIQRDHDVRILANAASFAAGRAES